MQTSKKLLIINIANRNSKLNVAFTLKRYFIPPNRIIFYIFNNKSRQYQKWSLFHIILYHDYVIF